MKTLRKRPFSLNFHCYMNHIINDLIEHTNPDEMQNLFQECINPNPIKRPCIKQIQKVISKVLKN